MPTFTLTITLPAGDDRRGLSEMVDIVAEDLRRDLEVPLPVANDGSGYEYYQADGGKILAAWTLTP